MAEYKERNHSQRDTENQEGAKNHGKPSGEGVADKPAGASGTGYVDGIGGTGGSSGTGAARADTGDIDNISGIDADVGGSDTADVNETASGESGSASGYRRSTSGNSGMPGMTRGGLRETVTDAEDARDNPPPNNTKKYKER